MRKKPPALLWCKSAFGAGFLLFLLTFSFDLWKLDQVCPAFVRNCLMSRGVIEEESRDKEKEVESEKSKTTAPFQPQRHVCPVRGRGGEGRGGEYFSAWWTGPWRVMVVMMKKNARGSASRSDLLFSFSFFLSFFPLSLSLPFSKWLYRYQSCRWINDGVDMWGLC